MILDCRQFKKAGIEVEDIAKRLMDYGFHAPTVSFPVAGTLMVEPTESESKEELDRFVEAMVKIREEIREVEVPAAPTPRTTCSSTPRTRPPRCSCTTGSAPTPASRPCTRPTTPAPTSSGPAVSRIDSAYGDRNLICSCTATADYADEREQLVQADKGPSY